MITIEVTTDTPTNQTIEVTTESPVVIEVT